MDQNLFYLAWKGVYYLAVVHPFSEVEPVLIIEICIDSICYRSQYSCYWYYKRRFVLLLMKIFIYLTPFYSFYVILMKYNLDPNFGRNLYSCHCKHNPKTSRVRTCFWFDFCEAFGLGQCFLRLLLVICWLAGIFILWWLAGIVILWMVVTSPLLVGRYSYFMVVTSPLMVDRYSISMVVTGPLMVDRYSYSMDGCN